MSNDIDCPYCDHPQDINHDDGYGYEEDVRHQMQCENCNKEFVFTTSISYFYEAEKADCLNDKNHDYHPAKTFPVECTKMRCSMCDLERTPTEQEMQEIINARKK